MAPTHERTGRFDRDWDALSPSDRGRFREMVTKFVADLEAGRFRPGIGVRPIEGPSNVYEVAFAPEGRATWEYGEPLLGDETHVIWRRVGTQSVIGRS
jgi:hypothetical protein